MGLSEGLRHSLESYLKKSAAELDDRGAEITFREHEVEYELKRLETLENELLERAARVEELPLDMAEVLVVLEAGVSVCERQAVLALERAPTYDS